MLGVLSIVASAVGAIGVDPLRVLGAAGAVALGMGTSPGPLLVGGTAPALGAAAQPASGEAGEPPLSPSGPATPGPRGGELDQPARPEGMQPSAQNAALADELPVEATRQIAESLEALAELQNADGSFGSGRYGKNVAVTALACLAFMADGHLPGRGKYGPVVQKGLENVLSNATETGLIAGDSGNGPMYGHGFATLFLGEVYGMTLGGEDTDLARRTHDALVKACRLIERTQNGEGGWRYNPVPFDADVSVTICQIMALRSARNAGIEVPKATIDRAVEYVRKCQNPDGGFMYQLPSGMSAWPRSAAGVASLYYAGIYSDQAIDKGVSYLARNASPDSPTRSESHYWYGMYYTAQTMYLAGGDAWARWWPQARGEILDRRASSGLWPDMAIGPAYGTSMALIVLQMPKRYLPIFQK